MGNNLFVTGFPYETTEAELNALFAACGTVLSAKILVERVTGRSRGIGFVLMSTDAEAQTAIVKLNGSEVGHRKIFVNEARPAERTEAPAYTGPERRSGQDRRRSPPAAAAAKKPWERKPWDRDRKPAFGGDKPWRKKPWDKDAKPAFGDKKPWHKKPWDKDRKPAFGDKKPWDKDKKPAFDDKKPWEKKPWDAMRGGKKGGEPFPKKKWGAGGPNSGRKPGDRMSKPGGFKRKPGGGFRG
jgi:RNA recognition motif-containing protein